jgi:hypothetical protein
MAIDQKTVGQGFRKPKDGRTVNVVQLRVVVDDERSYVDRRQGYDFAL